MTRCRVVVLLVSTFVAGFACATLVPLVRAQGRLTELKRVDLGSWCDGKEVVVSSTFIRPTRSRG
jgi:hypothetical protein